MTLTTLIHHVAERHGRTRFHVWLAMYERGCNMNDPRTSGLINDNPAVHQFTVWRNFTVSAVRRGRGHWRSLDDKFAKRSRETFCQLRDEYLLVNGG